jgi:hypothetical protein
MRRSRKQLAIAGVLAVVGVVVTAVAVAGPAVDLTGVSANTKSAGYAPASVLSPELTQITVAQGSTKVENPTDGVAYYGYDNDVLGPGGQPLMVPTPAQPATEAHKTEPDKNTYLVFEDGLTGADPAYDYGTHFLFQGHEGGTPGYITRINLDADAAHRVTLLATQDKDGHALATIDGSTWDPWAKRLLFTTENQNAATYAATPGYPSTVEDVSGALGRGGYEGIQDDEDGNIWIVEDIGGANKPGTVARIPNSFVYRYVPDEPGDLHDGKLQVLQVLRGGTAITQATQTALQSDDQKAVHTYGNELDTQWVTIHDTAVDGHDPFNANVKAKAANGTPFKRPENGLFRPGSTFTEFYFDETGDTNATSVENDCCGGWTAVLKLTQHDPSAATGKLSLVYKGDAAHAGFDNNAFFSKNLLSFVEDAGDTLHVQRNALDSAYMVDVTVDYSKPGNVPLRWLAEGRDASATLDSANGGFGKNDSDNEITGLYVSDGDPSKDGILGQRTPHPWHENGKWRVFYTQQHGDNPTYEVRRSK